jgi:type II secretory pathway pseudopilin PulG
MARGFTVLPTIAVIFVLLIVAATILPCVMTSRIAANEASATATLRTLLTAETTYAATYHRNFTDNLSKLGAPNGEARESNSNSADLVDSILAGRGRGGGPTSFTKNGYIFRYSPGGTYPEIRAFSITADPTARGSSGSRSFYVDESGVVRANAEAAASVKDAAI